MKRLLLIPLLFMLLLASAGTALAQTGGMVVGDGETISNDVTIIDNDLDVEAGGRINGDVVVWNGDVAIAGTIRGDMVVVNGDLQLEETAELRGECVVVNGEIEGEGDARCTIVNGLPQLPDGLANLIGSTAAVNPPGPPPVPPMFGNVWWDLAGAVGRSLLFGVLAFLIASLLPAHLGNIQHAVRQKPVASGTVGVLTAVAVPFLVVLLIPVSIILLIVCIGILGFPLMAAMMIGLVAAAFLGWVSIGNLFGEWLAQRLNLSNRRLATTATLGTVLLTLAFGLLGAIPNLPGESVISFFVMSVGLGAVALTKFGTRIYPSTSSPEVDEDKVTKILNMLPDEDPSSLKS